MNSQQPAIKEVLVSGKTVYVIDGLFSAEDVKNIDVSIRMLPYVLFNYKYTADIKHAQADDWQWIHNMGNPGVDTEFPLLPMIEMARRLHSQQQLTFRRAHVNCHGYGDHRHPHIDLPPEDGVGITCLYFVNATWDVDWAGELTFFEDGEPTRTIHPAAGRLVIFDGTLVHRGGVPARTAGSHRYTLACKLAMHP